MHNPVSTVRNFRSRPAQTASSLPSPPIPDETPTWAHAVLSELDSLTKEDKLPPSSSHLTPVSACTKLGTSISTFVNRVRGHKNPSKVATRFEQHGASEKDTSTSTFSLIDHQQPSFMTEQPTSPDNTFNALCDDLREVVKDCTELGASEHGPVKSCASMSRFMHEELLPVHRKRKMLDQPDLSEILKEKLESFDNLYPKVLHEAYSLVVGPQKEDKENFLESRICAKCPGQWASVGTQSK